MVQTRSMTVEGKKVSVDKPIITSWVLHSVKQILGTGFVRNLIVKTFQPDIKNAKKMRTFDAFQQYETAPFDDKQQKIVTYCEKIIKLTKRVVFTATNIQQNSSDFETHYQSYIVDNKNKMVHIIDPAMNTSAKKGYGIYKPMVSTDIVIPFFTENGYNSNFVSMTNPAQTNKKDVFCQSWSLYILLELLENGIHTVDIPLTQLDKYELLLDFYKQVLTISDVVDELNNVFVNCIEENKWDIEENGGNVRNIIGTNASEFLCNMKAEDLL